MISSKQKPCLRIATRNSPLALWQANFVRDALLHYWPELDIHLLPLVTSGDKVLSDNKFPDFGGKGLFVKELEEALLDHRADIAVHSMKDVPATFPEGLTLTTICARHNPYDALVSKQHITLEHLPTGARIGTSSLRRQAQLLALRPDLHIETLRGNIQTRLSKLESRFDAIILAVAGLERMSLQAFMTEILAEDSMLPACGQGALGIECRITDTNVHAWLAPLNDPISAQCVHTERHVSALLGGNCHVPLAVFCKPIDTNALLLRAKVIAPNGRRVIYAQQQGSFEEAIDLAERCAQNLLAKGAHALLRS